MVFVAAIISMMVMGMIYGIIMSIMSKRSDMIHNRIVKERFKERWNQDG